MNSTQARDLNLTSIPSSPWSITVGGVTYNYDLNYFYVQHNVFEYIINHSSGLFRTSPSFRNIFKYNTIKRSGYFVESIYMAANPYITSPASTCSNYASAKAGTLVADVAYFYMDSSFGFDISHNVIDEPRYHIANIDTVSSSLFLYVEDSYGSVYTSNNTITNSKGMMGDYNNGTLGLMSLAGLTINADAVYTNRIFNMNTG